VNRAERGEDVDVEIMLLTTHAVDSCIRGFVGCRLVSKRLCFTSRGQAVLELTDWQQVLGNL
jgi:hypothetical protein